MGCENGFWPGPFTAFSLRAIDEPRSVLYPERIGTVCKRLRRDMTVDSTRSEMKGDGAPDNTAFHEMIRLATPEIQELALQTRTLIYALLADVVEVIWREQQIAGYGVGPRKMSEQYCYISVHKKHVNLGFYYGAELPDPESLLRGQGKMMRHVKISSLQQLQNPALGQLIVQASQHLPHLNS